MKIIEILIVEDSRTQAEELKYILENYNYVVNHALNAEQALEILAETEPDIIISDIVMPGMDGYSFCSVVKRDGRLKSIPVILLTSLSDPKDIMKGLESGADSFLVKPYNDEILHNRIQYFIQNAILRKEQTENIQMDILYANQKYSIHSSPRQIMDVLLSTYENSILKYQELNESNKNLKASVDKLNWLNASLEQKYKLKIQEMIISNDKLAAVTEENKMIKENILMQKTLLEIAEKSIRFGGWSVNLEDNRLMCTEGITKIFGLSPGCLPAINEFFSLFGSVSGNKFIEYFADCAENGNSFDEIIQITIEDGKLIRVRVIGEAVYEEVRVVKVRGSVQDVTNQLDSN
jgi:DNA-binding response OmpR family regulator